jgi:hypothetical protein
MENDLFGYPLSQSEIDKRDEEARLEALDAMQEAWCRLQAEIDEIMGRKPN